MKLRVVIIEDEEELVSGIKETIFEECKKYHMFECSEDSFIVLDNDVKITTDNIVNVFANDGPIQLAIVDYQLDNEYLNGEHVIEIIDRHNESLNIKTILYSGVLSDAKEISRIISKGAFSFVGKTTYSEDKLDSDEKLLVKEIKRALKHISKDWYISYLANSNNFDLPAFLNEPGVFNNLQNGTPGYKVLLLSDLANSTSFFNWIKIKGHSGVGVLNEIIPELLGWQTDIIKINKGIIDKYYGDEVRAYFGKKINSKIKNPEASKDAENALKSAICIVREFRAKLVDWISRVEPDEDEFPDKIPYPRIILHYNEVVWGMFGNSTFRDFSIWTQEVAILNRVLKFIRDTNPCKTKYSVINESIVGEIFVTGDFRSLIADKNQFCSHGKQKFDIRSIRIYSYKFNDSNRCKFCLEERKKNEIK
jgi:class 3 adenylate cyclase